MFVTIGLRKITYCIVIIACLAIGAAVIHTENRDETAELAVIMYHSVLKDSSRTGKYIVRPDSIESDIRYLNSCGYTSVSARDIISYTKGGSELPKKSYILTFDDGSYNNLVYVLPILEKYDAYAVISVVGSYSEEFSETDEANAAYSYLRWRDINTLKRSGRVEIGNHSYDFHKIANGRIGAKIAKYEDKAQYAERFSKDMRKCGALIEENCGIKMIVYTYPFGAYCDESEEILAKNGYEMTFTCNEGKNIISRDAASIKLLKRFNRNGNLTTAEFFRKCKIY